MSSCTPTFAWIWLPLRFSGSPAGLQSKPPSSASRSPAGSPACVLPRVHTHRLVLVLQATGGHIRHGRGRSEISELRSPHSTLPRALALRSLPAATTQVGRTGEGKRRARFRFRVARRKWGGRLSGDVKASLTFGLLGGVGGAASPVTADSASGHAPTPATSGPQALGFLPRSAAFGLQDPSHRSDT